MAQRPSIHINERVRKLLQLQRKEGIVAVGQRDDLDQVDRSLLNLLNLLMASKGAFKGSEKAIQTLKKGSESFTPQTEKYAIQPPQDIMTPEKED
jgi:hypothetical protein